MKNHSCKFALIIFLVFFLSFLGPLKAEVSRGLIYPQYSKAISMDFQEASLKDVLKIFSQQSGLNFIASEAVQERKVTLYLDNVPVEEALEQILSANGLTYEMQEGSNIFVVIETGKPKVSLVTKVFFLKYASVSSSRISQEMLSGITSSVKSTSASGTSSSGTSSSTTPSASSSSSGSSSGASTTTFGIREALLKIISENGSVTEDSRTNSLAVTDVPSQFPVIEQTIAHLDIPLPQVMLEVEMLDVNKNAVDQMGIKFPNSIFQLDMTTAARATGFPLGGTGKGFDPAGWTMGRSGNTAGGWKVSDWPASKFGPSIFSVINTQLTLDFLRTLTDTKFLARPKLLTLSNQTAEIRITTQEAIGTKTSTQSAEGSSTQTAEAERAETGVSLRVTPQVNPETGEITMYIEPRVSQAKTGGTFRSSTGQDITFKDPEERGTKSIVRIKDGETIMIGGLIRTDFNQIITKVPILGDIPFLGAVFRHKNISKNEERELVVFITPHIIKENSSAKSPSSMSLNFEREQELPSTKKLAVEKSLADVEKRRR